MANTKGRGGIGEMFIAADILKFETCRNKEQSREKGFVCKRFFKFLVMLA